MIRYKIDILPRLKEKGFSSYRLYQEFKIGHKTLQDLRKGSELPNKTLNKLCELLHCDIGDIIEYIPDEPEK